MPEMIQRPAVSVIVPLLNAEDLISEFMDALSGQSYTGRVEIILVDNGSVDDTVGIASRYPVTLLYETGHKSPYIARNLGISESSGEIIALLDANKIPDSDWIEEGVTALESGGADLAGGEIRFDVGPGSTAGQFADAITFNNNRNYVLDEGKSAAGNLFFRRRVWEAMGPFPGSYRSGMDIWWTHKAVERGFKLVFADRSIVICKPRNTARVIGKAFRVGTVHPASMKGDGLSTGRILFESICTLIPPDPTDIKNKILRLDEPGAVRKQSGIWGVAWLIKIAMAAARFRGLAGMMVHGNLTDRTQ